MDVPEFESERPGVRHVNILPSLLLSGIEFPISLLYTLYKSCYGPTLLRELPSLENEEVYRCNEEYIKHCKCGKYILRKRKRKYVLERDRSKSERGGSRRSWNE